jgi:hypothetical protein
MAALRGVVTRNTVVCGFYEASQWGFTGLPTRSSIGRNDGGGIAVKDSPNNPE